MRLEVHVSIGKSLLLKQYFTRIIMHNFTDRNFILTYYFLTYFAAELGKAFIYWKYSSWMCIQNLCIYKNAKRKSFHSLYKHISKLPKMCLNNIEKLLIRTSQWCLTSKVLKVNIGETFFLYLQAKLYTWCTEFWDLLNWNVELFLGGWVYDGITSRSTMHAHMYIFVCIHWENMCVCVHAGIKNGLELPWEIFLKCCWFDK